MKLSYLPLLAILALPSLGVAQSNSSGTSQGSDQANQPTVSAPAQNANDNHRDWGWIGLIGLAGLAGLRRKHNSGEVTNFDKSRRAA